MINVTKKLLIIIAFVVWIIGGVILFSKSYALFKQALAISGNYYIFLICLITAMIIGLIKNKYIMAKFCIKNLKRIQSLNNPQIHQFYEGRFIIFLILMITLGFTLSKLSAGNYWALMSVGTLDLALSTALLTSSVIFFKKQ